LANETQDAYLLGMALLYAGERDAREPARLEEIERAHELLARADDAIGIAGALTVEGRWHARRGARERARELYDRAYEHFRGAAAGAASEASYELTYRQGRSYLDIGEFDEVERFAELLEHRFRRTIPALIRSRQLRAEVALLEGQLPDVERNLDLIGRWNSVNSPNLLGVWYSHISAQLNIAMGRPEVAVGQLDVFRERFYRTGLLNDDEISLTLELALGQSLCALYEQERVLDDPSRRKTLSRLREMQKNVRRRCRSSSPMRRAEALRLSARIELIADRPRRALREAEEAIARIGDEYDPIAMARCTEVRGRVLRALDRSEARQAIEQARRLYDHLGVIHPLILEGWPPPVELTTLVEE
jgi:tetratricopeptide (TPR) repeat protein